MLSKLSTWYADWEQQLRDILERPALAQGLAPGWRRCCAIRLGKLSPIERQQMHAFSLKYRGQGLSILVTLILALSAIGALVHLMLPLRYGWWGPVFMANLLGFAILWVCIVAWFNYRQLVDRGLRYIPRFFVGCIGSAMLGVLAMALLRGDPLQASLLVPVSKGMLGGLLAALMLGIPVGIITMLRNRQYLALSTRLQQDAERERLARELSESRLRMLRAQIEPHFLFNTLGAVQQLAEQGAPRAAELTANLIAFLRASLADMRSEQVSLQAEFGLVESYLQVMQVRLGQRLRFTLALPPALGASEVPSMILLTLVENAIKHGIEPALRGGDIAVTARCEDGKLSLLVQDSGVGLGSKPGTGLGIENVRTRLQLAYGGQASLLVSACDGGGVLAAIAIPTDRASRLT